MQDVGKLCAKDCHQNVTEHRTTSGHRATHNIHTCIHTTQLEVDMHNTVRSRHAQHRLKYTMHHLELTTRRIVQLV